MVTTEEIGGITLFAALDPAQREQLSRAAADIRLTAGEYAVHEGGERALFAVLEGRIEPVKLIDGIERVVGERHPGDLFGEVPLVLGTVFPVGFRAAVASRVMRVAAHDYHAVAAVVADVGKEVGRLAAHRMAGARGLQGIAADPPPPRALVVGHRWDASCAELRRFLDRNQITFKWLTPAHRMPRTSGVTPYRRNETGRRFESSTARPWCDRSSGGWPSCSGSVPSPRLRSTTRSSWELARPAWPRPCTEHRRA